MDAAEQAWPVLAQAAEVTVASHREGDRHPLWARIPSPGWHVLSRARVDRKLADGSMLFAAEGLVVAGRRTLDVPARLPGQDRRRVRVELRFGTVDIRGSPNENDRRLAKAVRLMLIAVGEVEPPAVARPPSHARVRKRTMPSRSTGGC